MFILEYLVTGATFLLLAAVPLTGAILVFSMIFAFLHGFLEPFFRK